MSTLKRPPEVRGIVPHFDSIKDGGVKRDQDGPDKKPGSI